MSTLKTAVTDWLRLKVQGSTPATPASGYGVIYDKNGSFAYKNAAGTETVFGSSGDVVGPASATDGNIALFDGTTGKIIKDGGAPTAATFSKTATMWHDQSVVTTGNAIAVTVNTSQPYTFIAKQNAAANGDVSENGFVIAAGTYSLKILYVKTAASGKIDVTIDGAAIVTIDAYAASSTYNQVSTTAGVVLTAGYHKIVFTVNGKNASSSNYEFYMTKMWLAPAGY
jgi:hypothetical protein